MQYNRLGNSDLVVSTLCLGTMTFGQQNTLDESHSLLDFACDQGINFFDTAEMYPVPAQAETYGLSERYLGKWLAKQQRENVVISTKMIGPGRGLEWIRQGDHAISETNIIRAVDGSLARLQTDYIDLLHIHWPDRYVPLFGKTTYDPSQIRVTVPIEEQLRGFASVIQSGKVRYLGLSNETSWGVCQFVQAARTLGLPLVISLQNAYNLLNRVFEYELAEVCHQEGIGLVAYSPLAFGLLSGKYLQGAPTEARLSLFQGYGGRYHKPSVDRAVENYVELAYLHQLKPAQLALAFVHSRWFTHSTIIGATRPSQLEENISSLDLQLDPQLWAEVDTIHSCFPNPAP